MALRNHDRVHLPRWYKAKNKETEAIRLCFQRNYDKFRKGLIHNIKVLNSTLYSKFLINDDTKMKDDIDFTLTVISNRLQNDDVAMPTFVGFCEAVYSISNCKHLIKGILSPGMRFTLGLIKEPLVLSASSDEELLEEAPENDIGGMASGTSMSDTEKLKEEEREKIYWQRLACEKTTENIQINKQLKEALVSLQSKDNTVKDLRDEVKCIKAKLVFRTQRMKKAEHKGEAARLAEQNAHQAERVSLKNSRQAVKARQEYEKAHQACEEVRQRYEEALETEEKNDKEESEADELDTRQTPQQGLSPTQTALSLQEIRQRQIVRQALLPPQTPRLKHTVQELSQQMLQGLRQRQALQGLRQRQALQEQRQIQALQEQRQIQTLQEQRQRQTLQELRQRQTLHGLSQRQTLPLQGLSIGQAVLRFGYCE